MRQNSSPGEAAKAPGRLGPAGDEEEGEQEAAATRSEADREEGGDMALPRR